MSAPPRFDRPAISEDRLMHLFSEELHNLADPNEAAARALERILAELEQEETCAEPPAVQGPDGGDSTPRARDADTRGLEPQGVVSPSVGAGSSMCTSLPSGTSTASLGRLAAAAEAGRRLAIAARAEDERLIREQIAQAEAAAARQREEEIEARRKRAQVLADQIETMVKTKPPPPPAESASESAAFARGEFLAASAAPAHLRSVTERALGRSAFATASNTSRVGGGTRGGTKSERDADDEKRAERIRTMASARRAREQEKALLLAEAKADRAIRNVRRPFAPKPTPASASSEATSDKVIDHRGPVGLEPRWGVDDPSSRTDAPDGGVYAGTGWQPIESLPPTSDAAARRDRISVRLPAGGIAQMSWQGGRPPIWAVLEWLARLTKMSTEELIQTYALMDRSDVPPRELLDEDASLLEAGLTMGATLILQPRGMAAAPQRGGAVRRAPARKPRKGASVPSSFITLPAGLDAGATMQGRLCGTYNISDSSWSKAGMLLVMHEGSAASRELAHAMQSELHFLSLAFCLPSIRRAAGVNDGTFAKAERMALSRSQSSEAEDDIDGGYSGLGHGDPTDAAAEEIAIILSFLRAQHPALLIRAIVGHGAAGDAALRYAVRYGAPGNIRKLVLVGAPHGNLEDAPTAEGNGTGSCWETLSLHGTADEQVPQLRAQLYHSRHRGGHAHTLRLLEGATHDFKGEETRVASTINDWLEGVRRLNADDRSAWGLESTAAGAAKPAPLMQFQADANSPTAASGGGEDDDLAFWGF